MLSTPAIFLVVYLLVNIASFLVYYLDKRAAVRRARRIPERTLLLLALIAPFGAVAAMRVFHHKTRKVKFYLVYVFLGLHLVFLFYTNLGMGKL